ncbi:MAG: hypothetical protein CML65_00995 [Rhodobacteraceae bacterium]|nr:hypothetical protein [Paracoccaceae bacterium]
MIWIAHKAKDGDTLDSIAKLYKNKDPKAILLYHMNKKVAPRLKKGEAMKKGDVVWVLNPKGMTYTVSNGKCSMLLEECAYKDTVKEANRVMDRVLEQQRINYNAACARHDAQIAINEDQSFVFAIVDTFNSVDEPMPQWRKAKAAYKKLATCVKGRDYKGFRTIAVDCELAVSQYNHDVIAWCHGLIDVTETTTSGLKFVRGAGEFCLFALIVTACAPAALGAAVAVGAGASATAGLVFDGYEQIGRAAAGVKPMSYNELGKRMVVNAITGATGALIVGGVMKAAGPWVARAISNNAFLSKWAVRASSRLVPKSVVEAEKKAAMKALMKNQGQGQVAYEAYFKAMQPEGLVIAALRTFMIRISVGAALKIINSRLEVGKLLYGWISSKPKELQGSDEAKIGAAAGQYLLDQGAGDIVLKDYLMTNMKDFRAVLRETIIEDARAYQKKAA